MVIYVPLASHNRETEVQSWGALSLHIPQLLSAPDPWPQDLMQELQESIGEVLKPRYSDAKLSSKTLPVIQIQLHVRRDLRKTPKSSQFAFLQWDEFFF